MDLETLREIFSDPRIWVTCGIVEKKELAPDLSALRMLIKTFPDEDPIVARMTWTGIQHSQPEVGDMVLLALCEGDEEQSFVISRMSGQLDLIPLRVLLGDDVIASRAGRKLSLSSDTRVNIGRGTLIEESEPLVLGTVLLDALDSFMANIKQGFTDIKTGPIGIGNLGFTISTHPTLVVKLALIEAQMVLDVSEFLSFPITNIVSQIAFTER